MAEDVKPAIVVDLVGAGRGTGYVATGPHAGAAVATGREGNRHYAEIDADRQITAYGSSIDVAVRRAAARLGITGTALISVDATGSERTIPLAEGRTWRAIRPAS
ncbi:hypothetical protein ACGFNU_04060 [Spirillospora sp. NPDC048911]|uniref:hypothetical protein n=1 Tax=Spirillospora sp. NPDC048911 TaxID=3364527 RepID=UPI00371865CE